jgi:hypothetical protein
MDVEDAVWECGKQLGLDDPHETCEHDRINAGRFQKFDATVFGRTFKLCFPWCTVEILARYPVSPGAIEYFRILHIGKHKPYVGVKRASLYRINNRLHVRACARAQHSQV